MLSIYKPNKSNTGCAFQFQIGRDKKNEEHILFISAILQSGWDQKTRVGSFKGNAGNPEKSINVKLGEFELGAIKSSIKNRQPYSTFHQHESNQTTIRFTPWDKPSKISILNPKTKKLEEQSLVLPAFGLTITRHGNNSFRIGLEPGEVEALNALIDFYFSKLYDQRLRKQIKDLKRRKDEREES
tara:strand:+ start:1002 stop:1556 length:555 start_codon:yes stop_codon:yes gene_type:complete